MPTATVKVEIHPVAGSVAITVKVLAAVIAALGPEAVNDGLVQL